MKMEQGMEGRMAPKKNKKILLVIAVLAVLLALGFWWLRSQEEIILKIIAPPQIMPDSSSAINQEVEALDIRDLDAEFQQIDTDLNQL